MSDDRPTLVVIAGANGAGKSTLTRAGLPGDRPVIDPDAIARRINPENVEAAGVAAGREAVKQQNEFLDRRESFVVETTLSGNRTLKLMDEARSRGFEVELHYVRLNSPDANVARVANRVERGGHDVPTKDVLRRYERSYENLPEAIVRSDRTDLHDNSGARLIRVAELRHDGFQFRDDPPHWATESAMTAARTVERNAETEAESDRAALRYGEAAVAAGAMTQEDLDDLRERIQDDGASKDSEPGPRH